MSKLTKNTDKTTHDETKITITIQCIEKLGELALMEDSENSELIHGFNCLAAQIAFQDGNRDIATVALEQIIRQAKEPKQILTSLRCLSRLKHTYLSPDNQSKEVQCMLGYVKKAFEIFKRSYSLNLDPDAQWFIKIGRPLLAAEHHDRFNKWCPIY
eukprot:gene81-681_t